MHEVPVHNDRDFAFPTSQFSHRFTILIYAAPFAHMRPFLYGQNFYIGNIISYHPPSIRAPRPLMKKYAYPLYHRAKKTGWIFPEGTAFFLLI